MIHKTLYKIDNNKNIRVWYAETEDNAYRVMSGTKDGKITTTKWKYAEGKNVGKANETTPSDQALKEVEALYEKQTNQGRYFDSLDDIENETYFKPMLAEKFKDVKKTVEAAFSNNVKVFSQPKLDGFRNVNTVDAMNSRNGKPFLSSPHIRESLNGFFMLNKDAKLDGELYNHDFKDNFNKLQSLISKKKPTADDFAETKEKVKYYVYDMFSPEMEDADFETRMAYLKMLDEQGVFDRDYIVIVDTVEVKNFEDIDSQYGKYLEDGYEGQMVRINGPYENKRTKNLIKRKEFFDDEFLIIDIQTGVGNWAGKAKRVVAQLPDGRRFEAGIRGTFDEMQKLLEDKDKFIGGEVTIRYPNKTPDGFPRFGVAYNFFEGKRDI